MRKTLVLLIISILTINSLFYFGHFETCQAGVLPKFYVDDDYDSNTPGWLVDHFNTIQGAINASSAGDRIVVYAGTYTETFTIYHELDLFGEDKELTIIDGGDSDDVISVNAENVNISHFTIQDSGDNENNSMIKINAGNAIITDNIIQSGRVGIALNNCDNNIIYDNTIENNNDDGIYVNHSDSNQITYNTITSNYNGLFLYSSSYNSIENNSNINSNTANGIFMNETSNYNDFYNNNLTGNTYNGIFLNDHCNYNDFIDNDIYSNGDSGIRVENSSNNFVYSSIVNSNTNYGIMIVGSSNKVISNTINYNSEHGVFLFADNNNEITSNTIKGNTKDGLNLLNSTSDIITQNEIFNNLRYGANLDYFTIKNLIYNNYFHDNEDNAMDKSMNNNYWNYSSSYSGTNIIGGSVIYGNYWDDYDEVSEGAIDSDDNEIADTEYTIYASNKDYGPILDLIAPTIATPTSTPATQTVGSYTYLSAEITDNTEIKKAYLILTDPNDVTTNFSIFANKTGNTFYCNRQFTPVGDFSYYIVAKDPRKWSNSSTVAFIIEEGSPPSVTDNTIATASPGEKVIFNASVTDDTDLAADLTVKVSWNHGDNHGNYSMNHVGENYFTTYAYLDNLTEDVYHFYAADQWGNTIFTDESRIVVTDTVAPEITVDRHNFSSDGIIHYYIVGVTVTDDSVIDDVSIEYWKEGGNHLTVGMDRKTNTYYEKSIVLSSSDEKIYCIVNSTDMSGNGNNTKTPIANTGGPYFGIVHFPISFDASNSFDLDGNIIDYNWTFGDGTTGAGETIQHSYLTNGQYNIKLTIEDDEGNIREKTSYVLINKTSKETTSSYNLEYIEDEYDVALDDLFYCYDTDGDDKYDRFYDPNGVLTTLDINYIIVEEETYFVIAKNNENSPLFLWNVDQDTIISISQQTPITSSSDIDESAETETTTITVEKEEWICIKAEDLHSTSEIVVTTESRTISSDMIWRKNGYIYILDDAETEYSIFYNYIYEDVSAPDFYPEIGQTVDSDFPTIYITYNVPVTITYATFGDIDILSNIQTEDYIEFSYTPPGYLEEDYYYFEIDAEAVYGTSTDSSLSDYYFSPYSPPPLPPEESIFEKYMLFIILGGIIGGLFACKFIMKKKNINFESFIYFKNRKIIPFIRPVVFGPLKIDVNDNNNIQKAEFYVNGILKDTLVEEPFVWNWDEPAFMKQKIETRIFDEKGDSHSSGEMTFFVFNIPGFKK